MQSEKAGSMNGWNRLFYQLYLLQLRFGCSAPLNTRRCRNFGTGSGRRRKKLRSRTGDRGYMNVKRELLRVFPHAYIGICAVAKF